MLQHGAAAKGRLPNFHHTAKCNLLQVFLSPETVIRNDFQALRQTYAHKRANVAFLIIKIRFKCRVPNHFNPFADNNVRQNRTAEVFNRIDRIAVNHRRHNHVRQCTRVARDVSFVPFKAVGERRAFAGIAHPVRTRPQLRRAAILHNKAQGIVHRVKRMVANRLHLRANGDTAQMLAIGKRIVCNGSHVFVNHQIRSCAPCRIEQQRFTCRVHQDAVTNLQIHTFRFHAHFLQVLAVCKGVFRSTDHGQPVMHSRKHQQHCVFIAAADKIAILRGIERVGNFLIRRGKIHAL